MARQFCSRVIPALSLAATVSSCGFFELGEDLDKLEDVTHLYTGSVSSELLELHSVVVVAMEDPDGSIITTFRMMGDPGRYEIRAARQPYHFFAFADMNRDLRFQHGEAFGWASNAAAVEPRGGENRGVDITIREPGYVQTSAPGRIAGEPLENHLNNYLRFNNGTVSPLDDPLFSRRQGSKGLWQPFAFVEDGGAGIHFLQPFDRHRTPVLFVHGINGSPQDFRHIIARLDKSKYQPWVLSYPSGLRLSWVSRGLFQFLEVLNRKYEFDELHLVAHSMGGLVTRGSLNLCVENDLCAYIKTYTTMSTPWNGVYSAAAGVKYSPEVVPAWRDLDPNSEFLADLFETPLPEGLPHHLIFGFRNDTILATESSDGVIDLSSQLRPLAQEQAETIRGFDESHSSILQSPVVIDRINSILAGPVE